MTRRGMTPAQVDSQYLHYVKSLELYGVDMHIVTVRCVAFRVAFSLLLRSPAASNLRARFQSTARSAGIRCNGAHLHFRLTRSRK